MNGVISGNGRDGMETVGRLRWAYGFDSTQLTPWKHVRKYMEEDGRSLQLGKKLCATDLSRVPEFLAEIVADAGGPAMDQSAIDQLIRLKHRP